VREEAGVVECNLDAVIDSLLQPDSYDTLPRTFVTTYQPFSKYPYIARDIALWIPSNADETEVPSIIRESAGNLLVRLEQFDRFEKENQVSVALHLIFQSFDRTLTEKEIEQVMKGVYDRLQKKEYVIR